MPSYARDKDRDGRQPFYRTAKAGKLLQIRKSPEIFQSQDLELGWCARWFVARCSIQLSYGRINELLLYGSFEKKQIFLKKLLEFLLDDC